MKHLDWYLARRYLSARKKGRFLSFITWIALGGVIVGVTALVVVIGVMTGMQEDLQEKILESSPHILVWESGFELRMKDWEPLLERVRSVEGVTAVAPFVYGDVVVHVFTESGRALYDLEQLWADAQRIEWQAASDA